MNITDVDDKIIRDAAREGIAIGELTARYTQAFLDDLDRAAHHASGRPAARHRPHRRHGRAHPDAARARSRLPHGRRLGLLPDRVVAGLRHAGAPGAGCAAGRRARRGGRVQQGRRPRLRAVEGPQARRADLVDRHRRGPAWLAHRVLRDVACATSARRSTSTRAASTSSSRTTRTRSPSRRPPPASRSCAPGCTAPTSRWVARRWPSGPATSPDRRTCTPAARARARCATPCSRRTTAPAWTSPRPRWPRRRPRWSGCPRSVAALEALPRGAAGRSDAARRCWQATRDAFTAALDDDLNVSPALAAVFDLVRELNRRDGGADAVDAPTPPPGLALLRDLDRVLAVVEEDATAAARRRAGAARRAGRGPCGQGLGSLRCASGRAGGAGRRGRGHQGRPALAIDRGNRWPGMTRSPSVRRDLRSGARPDRPHPQGPRPARRVTAQQRSGRPSVAGGPGSDGPRPTRAVPRQARGARWPSGSALGRRRPDVRATSPGGARPGGARDAGRPPASGQRPRHAVRGSDRRSAHPVRRRPDPPPRGSGDRPAPRPPREERPAAATSTDRPTPGRPRLRLPRARGPRSGARAARVRRTDPVRVPAGLGGPVARGPVRRPHGRPPVERAPIPFSDLARVGEDEELVAGRRPVEEAFAAASGPRTGCWSCPTAATRSSSSCSTPRRCASRSWRSRAAR